MSYNLPSRKLVSQQDRALIERPDVPRSRFTGSWTVKTTFDQGLLIPFMVEEILPGDHMRYNVTAYIRMSTPIFPMLDNLRVDTHFFYVPNRLVWDNWQRMMGEQDSPGDSIAYSVPQVVSPTNGFPVRGVADYFGLPTVGQTTAGQTISVNSLPFRAYNLIFNQWFRDENVTNAVTVPKGNGPDAASTYSLLYRAKSHDYFTSALPWPQKFTAPNVPMTGIAPIIGIGTTTGDFPSGVGLVYESTGNVTSYTNASPFDAAGTWYVKGTAASFGIPEIYAAMGGNGASAGFTINAFRQAMLIQTLLERDARGGTRYIEILKNHFGVSSPDARLQRAEYLGGGNSPLMITPVAQTAPASVGGSDSPVGILGGAGTAVGQHSASYAAVEHGFIIGLISVKSELSYQQGVHRMWSRATRYDYYWPSLAGLGEQAVLTKELYSTGVGGIDQLVFGYQARFEEYRGNYSIVSGMFRSYVSGTLDGWHLAQRFLSPPTLSTGFLQDQAPMSRVLAADTLAEGQQFLADLMIRRDATRPVPIYGTPASLMRF